MVSHGHTAPFYHPSCGDIVIGIVERRRGEDWQVDIGYSHSAILPMLAFDGATKKNCPRFVRGDVVAAFIDAVPDAGETMLSCVPRTKGESLGPLAGGTLLRLRPNDLERVESDGFIDRVVSRGIPMKVAFGRNGRAFVDTGVAQISVQVVHSIVAALGNNEPLEAFDALIERIDRTQLEQ